jgi:hypothetical protein
MGAGVGHSYFWLDYYSFFLGVGQGLYSFAQLYDFFLWLLNERRVM